VGYKGGNHQGIAIYNSTFTGEGFSIEIPFLHELGVEVYGCILNSTVSIPKSARNKNPFENGYEYSFWIHDNFCTKSYTVEGPRNYLRFSHNFIKIKKIGGRCYTQHGGDNYGPVWWHHNVAEDVDRSFIWRHRGRCDSMKIFNNTVYCADAEDRTAAILASGYTEGWSVKNNIFVCPDSRHRKFCPVEIADVKNNLCINVNGVPSGNFIDKDPGLKLSGDKPFPWYAPAGAASFVVDRGVDVGLDYIGAAPDIGAYEYSSTATWIRWRSAERDRYKIRTRIRYDHTSRRLYALTPGEKGPGMMRVRILDACGRIAARGRIPRSGTGAVELPRLCAGRYVAEVRSAEKTIGACQFTVH
jgi:hypothetical protein